MFERRSESFRRALVYAWALFALLIIGSLAWTNHTLARQFKTSFDWVSHTEQALYRAEEALSLLKDIENGQRGYVLTGDSSYLEPYYLALSQVRGTIEALRGMEQDNPSQHARVLKLSEATEARIKVAQETIAAREKDGLEGAIAVINSGRGRVAMESARRLVAAFKAEERRRLATRQIAASDSLERHRIFSVAMLGFLVVASAIAFWYQRRLAEMHRIVKICAWTRQIEHDGQWMTMEKFLKTRFGLDSSHGMSQKAAAEFRDEMQIAS